MQINLTCNHIAELPAELGTLVSLTALDVSDNDITALPDVLLSLKGLTQLELYKNKITALPLAIGDLKELKVRGARAGNRRPTRRALLPLTRLSYSRPHSCSTSTTTRFSVFRLRSTA